MNHQGLRCECRANKWLNLYKRGFKIFDLLVPFILAMRLYGEVARIDAGMQAKGVKRFELKSLIILGWGQKPSFK